MILKSTSSQPRSERARRRAHHPGVLVFNSDPEKHAASSRTGISRPGNSSYSLALSRSELRKFSGKSYSGRYPTSGSRSFVAKYFLVGVRIRNEYPHVATLRLLLLRVLKTRPGVGIAFRGTPATPSTPPDPAHNRQSALRIGSHTPPQAPSTTPPSPGVVALGP